MRQLPEHYRRGEVMPKTPIDMMMDGVEWIPVKGRIVPQTDDIPYVTHEGVLDLLGIELKVYTLSDRTRIIDAESLNELFGLMEGLTDAVAGRTMPIEEVREKMRRSYD